MNLPEKAMENANPFVLEYFQDPNLFPALPEEIRNSEERLTEIVQNTSRFSDLIHKERQKRWNGDLTGLLGEEVQVPEKEHADGRTRHAEDGYRVNVDYLKTINIDASKVLFFRLTQPSDEPKPEYYWTSDYFEVLRGLDAEIPGEQRDHAVILVSDLETISGNEGLIQDMNDDQGLSVRQIGTGSFDQKKAIARFKPDHDLYDEPEITLVI
ncbi:hypothetical protein KY338_06605 [Candidatus Woesearchaeota archaeon]|nr:hypothetical protein [Candidatus Woesearchaeota archaeon]MBW3006403.1 hypothetical protein [Candidatus Woesearchaeota archaeon]